MCRMLSEGGRSASMDKTLLTKLKERKLKQRNKEEVEAWPVYSGEIKILFEHARVGTGKLDLI